MRFGFVPPPFDGLWAGIVRLLDRAVKRGENEWPDVEAKLNDGRAQLWLTVNPEPMNATVTRMDGTTLEIWLCGGAVLSGSLHHIETILKAAAEIGATDARIIGRKGWERVLGPYGWRVAGDELVKDLS